MRNLIPMIKSLRMSKKRKHMHQPRRVRLFLQDLVKKLLSVLRRHTEGVKNTRKGGFELGFEN
jgi:hypothetical protein